MSFFDINVNTENESECSEIYPLCKYYNSEIQNTEFHSTQLIQKEKNKFIFVLKNLKKEIILLIVKMM